MTIHIPQSIRPAWLPVEERKDVREPLGMAARLIEAPARTRAATVVDISTLGCRIACDAEVSVGRYLTVEIPGHSRYAGWVAWCASGEFGLDFSTPLPTETLRAIVDRRGDGSRTG